MKKKTPPLGPPAQQHYTTADGQPILPVWDADLRRLWVVSILVKAFTGPAANQELILTAYQEEDWRRMVDDPLPPLKDMDAPTRLGKAITRLNGRQHPKLLIFHACRNSSAVVWEWALTQEALRALLEEATHANLPGVSTFA